MNLISSQPLWERKENIFEAMTGCLQDVIFISNSENDTGNLES